MSHFPVLFGYPASDLGNSHVPLSLCRYWHESGRAVRLTVPSTDISIKYPWLVPVISGLKKRLVYRFGSDEQPRRMTEQFFLKNEGKAPYVYLWAALSMEIFEEFHQRGSKIIIERINCHRRTSRNILQNASAIWNIPIENTITEQAIAEEEHKLALTDSVFRPSPMVWRSMAENGVSENKLLSTSYGWSPERFPEANYPPTVNPRPVFLFAGNLCLRKGIPLLLEAWHRADLNAELVLCGSISPEIQNHCPLFHEGKNIRHVAYTRNIGQLYRSADIFVFPSLEEGGPMVTYEAMAHGIPPLVTAMGGGAIVQNELNGLVLPDMDIDAWAQAMTLMAENPVKRAELGRCAKERAQHFTWKRVAAQRAALLEKRYPSLWDITSQS